MAVWNFERFEREIQKPEVANIYCIFGEETYLIEETVSKLVTKVLDGAPQDFNVDVFYAGESDVSSVKDAIEMLPMMSPRRFVILKSADLLKAKDFEDLQPLVDNPIDSTVFVVVADKIDQRKKFFKSMDKNGVLVKLDRLPENQLPAWIQQISKKEGKEISQDAVLAMMQLVGSSLLDVNNEIRKLAQFIGTRSTIEVGDVREIVSHSRMESVFGLTNAIGDRDRAKALTYLAQLLDHGESEVGILALISRHIRILISTKECQSQGMTRAQIASRVGVPSFFVQNYIDQAMRWAESKLEETHGAILETDRALKSSPVSSHIWLENFILKTCS